jgi:hypothetical protein
MPQVDTPATTHLGHGAAALRDYRFIQVKCATTANHGLSGTASVDGQSLSAGDLVLVWKQSTAAQNGVYVVQSGTWKKVAQPLVVFVMAGSTYGRLALQLTAANTYSANGAVYI